MKIALLNFSGNVGKTTFARDLLKIRMNGYKIITVDSVNTDGKEELVIRGEDGDRIYTEILVEDNLILDIGSSNLEQFFNSSKKEAEIIDSIDLFILPTTPEAKQQADTAKTVTSLLEKKIDSKKIHIVANQVIEDSITPLSSIFNNLLNLAKTMKISFDLENSVEKHNLYSMGETLSDILTDEDYRAKMNEAKANNDIDNARMYADKYVTQKKAINLNNHYQKIYDKIVAPVV